MTGASLLSRYEFNVGWDAETLLDIIAKFITNGGKAEELLSYLDAFAEQEMELYAGMARNK